MSPQRHDGCRARLSARSGPVATRSGEQGRPSPPPRRQDGGDARWSENHGRWAIDTCDRRAARVRPRADTRVPAGNDGDGIATKGPAVPRKLIMFLLLIAAVLVGTAGGLRANRGEGAPRDSRGGG